MPESHLTWPEMLMAGQVGVLRQTNALKRQLVSKDAHHHDSMEGHVSGAIAELAVAKYLGVYWDPAVGITHAGQVAGDVGQIEVRSTAVAGGCLICHEYSFDERAYLLVLSDRAPVFVLRGWLWGREAKEPEWWRDNVPRPAFFVPQPALRPVDELFAGEVGHAA